VDNSEKANISGERMPVRAGSRALVTFSIAAAPKVRLVVEHLYDGQLLARERQPLKFGSRSLEIKTHPEASHVVCSLKIGDRFTIGADFGVDCGERIEPTGKNFIVIGAMKAGTTTLFNLLKQHPALCQTYAELPGFSFMKEVNYFNRLYREGDTDLHYDWRFPFDPVKHAWTLDVSPNYAKLPRTKAVPRRIAALAGDTKLVYILRNPVDRIESNQAHRLRTKGELQKMNRCIRTSRYALHMDRFTEHIPREDILLLDFHELKTDPAAVQIQICDFLGIDHFVAKTHVHNKRGVNFKLDAAERIELAEILRPDVQLLFNRYGFKPAKRWLDNRS